MPSNILTIWIDDLFDIWLYRQFFGANIPTPNLDRFLQRATRFDASYCLVPVCVASRAAANTGWSPAKSGVISNGEFDWYDRIPARDANASVLRRHGYHVVWGGKVMHGYYAQPPEARRHLHDVNLPSVGIKPATTAGLPGVIHYLPGNAAANDIISVEGKDEEFYDRQISNFAIQQLGQMPAGKPWAMMVGMLHPHSTLECPKWAYDAIDFNAITTPPRWANGRIGIPEFADRFTPVARTLTPTSGDAWRYKVWGYLAAIYHVDFEVGRILDALDASPHADNTAVFILSDHGFSLGHRDWWGKFTVTEESARTPFLVRAPGQQVGTVETTPVSLMDLFPTMLDFADIPKMDRLAGQSVRPLLPGQTGTYENRGALTFVHGTISGAFQRPDGTTWRYLYYPDNTEELYNLTVDGVSAFNLAATEPAIAAEMRARLVVEAARYDLVQASTTLPTLQQAVTYLVHNAQVIYGGSGNDEFQLFANGQAAPQIIHDGGRNSVTLTGWAKGAQFTLPPNIDDFRVGVQPGGSSENTTFRMNDRDNVVTSPQRGGNYYGGGGNDFISVSAQGPYLYGEAGDDTLVGGRELHGGAGNDSLVGGTRSFGGSGQDTIVMTGPAFADGGSGDDVIIGSTGNDTMQGGSGNDSLVGGAGNDSLVGGLGFNTLEGGAGLDTLVGDSGDRLIGGAGADRFVIGTIGAVQIGDWEVGEVIDISSWGAVTPIYRQTTTNSVTIQAGERCVFVNSLGAITAAQVQAGVVQ